MNISSSRLLLKEILLDLLELRDVDLKVLVPLELLLYWDDVLRVPDLPLVGLLEVLLELIQLASQDFTLILDLIEFPRDIDRVAESVLLDYGFPFGRVEVDDELAGVRVAKTPTTASSSTTSATLTSSASSTHRATTTLLLGIR